MVIMKKFLLSVAAAFILFAAVIVPAEDARAQSIGFVVYDFSSYPISTGLSTQYYVSQAVLGGLLQKNPDGTLAVDQSGSFYADSALVSAFVGNIAAVYDQPGVLTLDRTAEAAYLTKLIASGSSDASHKPVMKSGSQQADAKSTNEAYEALVAASNAAAANESVIASIPDKTYIDVNLTTQTLVYYIGGTPTLVTDIVTGNTNRGHGTPQGLYHIYNKQRGRTLRGEGYEAYVNYWMPFVGNYGLHDATWRSSFGGTIYQRNGSHGCVNMPKSMAATLFETAAVGTPVFVHQ